MSGCRPGCLSLEARLRLLIPVIVLLLGAPGVVRAQTVCPTPWRLGGDPANRLRREHGPHSGCPGSGDRA